MFNITEFRTSINTKGVLRTNRYIVSLTTPNYLKSFFGTDETRLISLRCDNVDFPGMSLASADGGPRYGYGPIEKNPYGVNFDDVSLTFIVDSNSSIHRFFYTWVQSIVNFRGEGGQKLKDKTGIGGAKAYEVGYKDEYCTDLTIDVYRDSSDNGSTAQKVMSATAFRAFPMAMPAVRMSWGDADVIRLNIPFAYTDFKVTYQEWPEIGSPVETGASSR